MPKNSHPASEIGASKIYSSVNKWSNAGQPLRAREIVRRSGGLMRGKFPSQKNGRMIHWESQLERDAVLLFEFSPGVLRYREQPFSIFYGFGAKTLRYTPDFEVTFTDNSTLVVEIKPAQQLAKPEVRQKYDRIRELFVSRGQRFRIITDTEIRQPQLLENLRLLQRYQCPPLSVFDRKGLLADLRRLPIITTFKVVAELLGSSSKVWELIRLNVLHSDPRSQIDNETLLTINFEDHRNDDVYF